LIKINFLNIYFIKFFIKGTIAPFNCFKCFGKGSSGSSKHGQGPSRADKGKGPAESETCHCGQKDLNELKNNINLNKNYKFEKIYIGKGAFGKVRLFN
jgi:hypothetical protein